MADRASPQVEADRRLLQFSKYEDYLDSLVTPYDVCFLKNTKVARTLAELGYRYVFPLHLFIMYGRNHIYQV